VPITVTFSAAVTVTGSPQLVLNDGGVASYASGSGSSTLTFNYVVNSGDNSQRLDYASTGALSLNGGTITAGGTPADVVLPTPGSGTSLAFWNLFIDTTPPTVTVSAPSEAATTNGTGSTISYTVTYFDLNFNSATLAAAKVSLTNPAVTGTIAVNQVNATNYTVTVSGLAGLGSQAIAIAAGTATDLAGNGAVSVAASASFRVMSVPFFAQDSVIANRSSYLQAGEVLLVRTNGTQELLTTALYDPYTVAVDASGNILVACYQTPTGDYATNAAVDGGIFKIDQYTLALSGVSGYTNFTTPFGVAVEPDGHILVADLDANTMGTIFRVDPVTGVAVVLSKNNATYGTNFYWLAGIAVATNGGTETIYVTDHGDGATLLPKVISINPATGVQTVLVQGAPLQNPDGLAVDPSGGSVTNIYVADKLAATLMQLGKTTGSWTATAITTTPANTMQLPTHVAIDPVTGDLFVTDAMLPTVGNPVAGALWRISSSGFTIESISSGGFFEQPRGVSIQH
jgi:sugar lactone lactonase YvrE